MGVGFFGLSLSVVESFNESQESEDSEESEESEEYEESEDSEEYEFPYILLYSLDCRNLKT